MSRRAAVVAIVVAFLLGLSLGVNGGLLIGHHFSPPRPWFGRGPLDDGPPHGRPRGFPPGPPLAHIGRMLGLSPEQHDRIRAHIEATREHTRELHDSLRVRIESELTPRQRERWKALQPRRHRDPGEDDGPWARPHRAEPGSEGESR